MEVTYFIRNKKAGFSIGRVFETLLTEKKTEEGFVMREVPRHKASPFDIMKNLIFVYKNRSKTGINHITGDIHYCIIPLLFCKTVLTVHDVVVMKSGNLLSRFIKWLFWIYLPVKIADEVTCISLKTKTDLLHYVKKKRISVIHNPLDPSFQTVKKPFNKLKPVVLHIGTGWNKNLDKVVDALYKMNIHLRIVGKLEEKNLAALNRCSISFSTVENLSNQEIIAEYNNCDIVSFPSLYEGFGMPIIEGQKVGRAILTSNVEPIPEIASSAAHFVDPESTEEIKEGFQKLIKDDCYRAGLIYHGFVNVERYEVKKIYRQYYQLYEAIY